MTLLFVLFDRLTTFALLFALFLALATLLGLALLALFGRFAEHNVFTALVEPNDAKLQLVAFEVVILEVAWAVLQLAARHERFHVQRQFDHEALVFHTDNFALRVGALFVGTLELIPRIGFHLLVAQRDAAAILINVEDLDIHILALLDHIARMAHLLRPRQIADVHQSVDTWLNFDEDAEVGDVAHRTREYCTRRITIADAIPWVGLQLLHTEGDLLVFLVNVEDLDLHQLAERDHLAGMVNMARPRHFADVNKALDPFLQLHKGTVVRN